jgi:hypothetical protein
MNKLSYIIPNKIIQNKHKLSKNKHKLKHCNKVK